ncbi:AAA family ATPase [Pseudomonas plecoglossicida]|uniref:Nuclease SbcCD subunit C n=1 Tax=Pseudomonas plecoglossicida TaxID=70775 RepID=A0AAD0VT58_PSEDL|nr:AAA family ATPase [Pseudomonas plecoglossicida]AXM95802.1 chromosome segregation protein SMC [Pseudomonas plecoglossicida]EPB96013.1 SMC domain-containing protein [Pseudomonas plecoglossicida NB2011]QLB56551.1 AAA family ATPase [Pseudomonas plecoglossicida]GLR35903.1 nuclease SbcCD subunit C [Pseudomonas plecoglossicida]
MKILAIRLKNLASLAGPVDIDFTAEPLASAGLFAITGPTGAGKSTLLDALCLALFGTVPRLNDIGREAKVPDADGDIPTSDPRNLLRRGSGNGYAEVDFVGIDGHRYRARWEANRARDKANGKLQNSRQSLYDLDSEQLLGSGKSEYKQLIEARLGLNFEQFTRAVMLAQSEFGAFLKADDKERSELLEKLTNTAIYTRLGQRAFSKARETADTHKALNDRASHLLPMATEARAELDQRLEQAQQQFKADQAGERQLELQRKWLEEQCRLNVQHAEAGTALQAAELAWQQLAGQRLDLQRLERLAPQRHQFHRQQTLTAQRAPVAALIAEQQHQQAELQGRTGELEQALAATREALAHAQARQGENAPRLRQAFAGQDNLARLDQDLLAQRSACQQAEQHASESLQQLKQLEQNQQRSLQQLAQIDTALTDSQHLAGLANAWQAYLPQLKQVMLIGGRLAKGREELPGLQAQASQANAQLQAQRDSFELLFREAKAEPQALAEQIDLLGEMLQDNRKQQRAVEALSHLHGRALELRQQIDSLGERQQQAMQQRQRLIGEGTTAKAELEAAEHALNLTRQLLERQRLARNTSVEELRGQLRDGEPCPVCGSAEHPFHQPEALLQSLGRHDQAEEDAAQKQVEALNGKLVELRTQLGVVNAQLKDGQQQQLQLGEQLQPLMTQVQAHSLWPALAAQDESARSAWLDSQLRRLDEEIGKDEQRQSALLALQKDAARLNQQLQAAQDAQQQALRHLEQQHQALANDERQLEQALADLAGVLPGDVLKALTDDPANAFLALDQQIAQRLQQLEQRKDEQEEQQAREIQLDKLRDQQQARQHSLEQLQQQLASLDAQGQQARAALGDLLGEHASAEAWQLHMDSELQQARTREAETAQQLQALRTQDVQLASELKANTQQQQSLENECQQLQGEIAHWRAEHPELDDAGLDRLLAMDDAQLSELRQCLQGAEKAIEQGRVLLQERQQRLQEHAAHMTVDASVEDLEQALGELRERLTGHEQQCAELRAQQADDQRRQQAHQALAGESELAYQQWQRWARLSTLIGSASGDVFRKIAQGYNLDLLLHHANAQLRQLARRYRLKRGGSALGLLVLDTEMGDELRSVHSLSGGETFLVSLALALGLASMASSTLRIESLFIDEGFGSLDPESLQLAMDALDGLQAQGRKVAVISHVQEMHERIPVQIQVRRQGNGLSDVEVCG